MGRKTVVLLALALILFVGTVPAFDMRALAAYNMPYYIEVDLTNQIVTVYSTETDVIVRQMLCSTGLKGATPKGTYYMPAKVERLEREEWYYFRSYSCYAHYASRIYKNVLFHSIPCSRKSDTSISKTALAAFGRPASHGCVRLRWQDAEFIAKCCLEGTRVRIFESDRNYGDLRELLFAASYTNEKGISYKTYLGISEEEGVLGRNSKGKEVIDLQTRLRDLGFYSDEIDGDYQGSTINAVREAQRMIGEEETGLASVEFQQAIMDDAQAPVAQNVPMQEGMSGPVVRNMQQYLRSLELYEGDIDGVYDVDVTEAVRKFQGSYGYPTNGILAPEIQKALYYESGKVQAMFSQSAAYECHMTAGQLTAARLTSNVSVRLRKKPSAGSDALTRLNDGDLMVAIEHGDEFSKVQRGRDVGYINNRYLQFYAVDIYELRYTASDSNLSYTIGSTEQGYYNGAVFPVETFQDYLASGGSLDDHEGIATFARVNTDSSDIALNLREAPNTSGNVLAELPDGTEVRVLLQSSEWSLVEWEGQSGYLMNSYLEFWEALDEEKTADVDQEDADDSQLYAVVQAMSGSRAPVYDVDSDDATILGYLDNITGLTVVQSIGGWSLISYKEHTGYMKDEDLRFQLADEIKT
ncbi:MAG: peptidoglycan-binding protein [Clostridia bacterium]|nr:peptidoglycan-binding protein [Clostridia bacterium]